MIKLIKKMICFNYQRMILQYLSGLNNNKGDRFNIWKYKRKRKFISRKDIYRNRIFLNKKRKEKIFLTNLKKHNSSYASLKPKIIYWISSILFSNAKMLNILWLLKTTWGRVKFNQIFWKLNNHKEIRLLLMKRDKEWRYLARNIILGNIPAFYQVTYYKMKTHLRWKYNRNYQIVLKNKEIKFWIYQV